MSIDATPTIGLDGEQRNDPALRALFLPLFALVAPSLDDTGNWRSSAHEMQAIDALARDFPDVTGMRQFAVLARIANLKSEGRVPS
jgi:hypothetical protein